MVAAEFQIEANSLSDLGLRDAADLEIFQQARQPGIVLISKDSDFVDYGVQIGPPPQLLWVTCGNVTNRHLQAMFGSAGRAAMNLLEEGLAIVEIS